MYIIKSKIVIALIFLYVNNKFAFFQNKKKYWKLYINQSHLSKYNAQNSNSYLQIHITWFMIYPERVYNQKQ